MGLARSATDRQCLWLDTVDTIGSAKSNEAHRSRSSLPQFGLCRPTPLPATRKPDTTIPANVLVCPEGGTFDTSALVGKTEKEAQQLAEDNKCELRVTESFPVAMDLRPNRINVKVDNGKVTSVG